MRKQRSLACSNKTTKARKPNDWSEAELAKRVRALVGPQLTIFSSRSERELFLERIERMAALIAFWGARINLTAAPRDPVEIAFHIIDSLAPISLAVREVSLRAAFGSGNHILDLGSGAGFPGLVLASASPALFTLLEARRKRASFLAIAAAEMGLNNVTLESRRLLPNHNRPSYPTREPAKCLFNMVTARAFSSPSTFHAVAASVLGPGGTAILYASPAQDLSLASAEENGLVEFHSVSYAIPRNDRAVERILAWWRQH